MRLLYATSSRRSKPCKQMAAAATLIRRGDRVPGSKMTSPLFTTCLRVSRESEASTICKVCSRISGELQRYSDSREDLHLWRGKGGPRCPKCAVQGENKRIPARENSKETRLCECVYYAVQRSRESHNQRPSDEFKDLQLEEQDLWRIFLEVVEASRRQHPDAQARLT